MVNLRAQADELKRRLDHTDASPAKKFKLSGVVDQSLDEEILVMAKKDVHAAFQGYEAVMGGPPPVDAACTDEQPPRMQTSPSLGLMYTGSGRNGSLALQEQHGPPSVQEWERCFAVLRTILIQLKAASPANLTL
eukprot:174298-Amphidinium_carterae.1